MSRARAPDTARPRRASGALRVMVETGPAGARQHVGAWQALADRAAEPNVFYEPWVLLAALETQARGTDTQIVFVYGADDAGERLIGVFAFERRARFRGLPIGHLRGWQHPQIFLAVPLIDPARGAAAWRAMLAWARQSGARLLDLPLIPGGSPALAGLAPALDGLGGAQTIVDRFSRRLLVRGAPDGDAYIAAAASAKSRKRWRRLWRRLSEHGELALRILAPDDPITPWAEDFLALEARGWKGRRGTALGSSAAEAQLFRTLCAAGHRRGAVSMLGLYVDGTPIAMQCNLHSGSHGFAFKVCYDEDWSQFSPGVLLELEAIRHFLAREDFATMDSCTGAQHALMARIWSGSRDIERHIVAPGGAFNRLALRIVTGLMAAKVGLAAPRRPGTEAPAPIGGET